MINSQMINSAVSINRVLINPVLINKVLIIIVNKKYLLVTQLLNPKILLNKAQSNKCIWINNKILPNKILINSKKFLLNSGILKLINKTKSNLTTQPEESSFRLLTYGKKDLLNIPIILLYYLSNPPKFKNKKLSNKCNHLPVSNWLLTQSPFKIKEQSINYKTVLIMKVLMVNLWWLLK